MLFIAYWTCCFSACLLLQRVFVHHPSTLVNKLVLCFQPQSSALEIRSLRLQFTNLPILGFGVSRPLPFGMGSWGWWGLHEITCHVLQKYEMKTLSKDMTFQK